MENGAENHTHPIGKLFKSHHKRQRYLIFLERRKQRLGTMIQYFTISILIINIWNNPFGDIYCQWGQSWREISHPQGAESAPLCLKRDRRGDGSKEIEQGTLTFFATSTGQLPQGHEQLKPPSCFWEEGAESNH